MQRRASGRNAVCGRTGWAAAIIVREQLVPRRCLLPAAVVCAPEQVHLVTPAQAPPHRRCAGRAGPAYCVGQGQCAAVERGTARRTKNYILEDQCISAQHDAED